MSGAAGLLRKERGNYSSLKLVNNWEYYLMYLKYKYKFNIYTMHSIISHFLKLSIYFLESDMFSPLEFSSFKMFIL